MKTFFLAAIAAAASANELLENPTDIITAVDLPLSGTISVGNVTGKTGWSKNGSGSDATLDVKLWMDWSKTKVNDKTYINTPPATHYIAIQSEDLTSFEGQKMTFSAANDDGEIMMQMAYKTWEADVPADFEGVDFGSDTFPAYIKEAGVRFSENFAAPVGFWTIDSALCANIETNWWLGLTRDTPGVAEITTGVTRKLTYQMDVTTSKVYKVLRATVDATWAVDNSVDENENSGNEVEVDENSGNEGEVDNTDGGDGEVDNTDGGDGEADDGATGVTTFAGAVIAAIATLAF